MKVGEIFYFDENYSEKAAWCNQNSCFIKEIEGDEKGRRFTIVEAEKPDKSEIIRIVREEECFPIVNRGKLWYDQLTSSQFNEMKAWYEAWLDAPATGKMPKKPKWII